MGLIDIAFQVCMAVVTDFFGVFVYLILLIYFSKRLRERCLDRLDQHFSRSYWTIGIAAGLFFLSILVELVRVAVQ